VVKLPSHRAGQGSKCCSSHLTLPILIRLAVPPRKAYRNFESWFKVVCQFWLLHWVWVCVASQALGLEGLSHGRGSGWIYSCPPWGSQPA
jgi:hypothetical protein